MQVANKNKVSYGVALGD